MSREDNPNDTDVFARRRRDLDDYHNELAGRETGRAARFLPPGARGGQSKEKQERERRNWSRLQTLLRTDPAYAALYNDTMDLLTRAEAATEEALQRTERDLTKAQNELNDTLDSADRLPDGTRIFRDADGNIYTEDGRVVGGEEAASIEWREDAPSYEDYLARHKAAGDAERRVDELRRYQVDVLGRVRDRMTDPDNPPSPEDMEQAQKEIQDGLDGVVLNKNTMDARVASTYRSEIELPTLGS